MVKKICTVLLIRDVFTEDDCKLILKTYGDEDYASGLVQDNRADFTLRKSSIQFIHPDEESHWIFEKLLLIVQSCNTSVFDFDLNTFEEGFQFTKYEVGDHYTWHTDIGEQDGSSRRKLSMTVQLNDDYEGGDLQFFPVRFQVPRERGLVAVFPSFLPHCVSPVTRGIRHSLVSWVAGERTFA